MLGAAIAYNLKKWLKFESKKAKVIPMAMKVPKEAENNLRKHCFLFFNQSQHQYLLLH